MITGLKYVMLPTAAFSATMARVEQILGISAAFRDGDRWAEFKFPVATRLAVASPEESGGANAGPTIIFDSDDLEADLKRLAVAGLVPRNTRDMGSHGRVAAFEGDDGTQFQVFGKNAPLPAPSPAPVQDPVVRENFRTAMRRLAASVCAIAAAETERCVMTATAVSSVTVDPATLLVCINRSARIHALLRPGRAFSVNIFSAQQMDAATRCSNGTDQEDRFRGATWESTPEGTPYLTDAQAYVLCVVEKVIEHGTHSIVLGRVTDAQSQPTVEPLLYVNGGYGTVQAFGNG